MSKKILLVLSICLLLFGLSSLAVAAMTEAEVARLGQDLTPLGAEKSR